MIMNIEDLTDILEGTTKEAENMEEEPSESVDGRPLATVPLCKRQTTSTYEGYKCWGT